MKSSVQRHEEFLASLLTEPDFDEIDEAVAEVNPTAARSEREVQRLNRILDSLERRDG